MNIDVDRIAKLAANDDLGKVWPDSADGARSMLKSLADPNEIKNLDQARAKADPAVDGVWAFLGVNDGPEPDVVVYLAGYSDTVGRRREMNDFEFGKMR